MNYFKNTNQTLRLIPRHKNGNKIIKAQDGSDSNTWSEIGDAASYMIPIYGTYRSIKDAWEDPSISNIGMAGLSLLGDVGTLAGAGALVKGAVTASKTAKALNAATKSYQAAQAVTDAAQATAKASAKASARAAGRVNSLTLQNAPIPTIMKAQKSANAVRAKAKADQAAYEAALLASNGTKPVNQIKNIGVGDGVMKMAIPKNKYVNYNNAGSIFEQAKNEARWADEAYDKAKSFMKYQLIANPGFHAAGQQVKVLSK